MKQKLKWLLTLIAMVASVNLWGTAVSGTFSKFTGVLEEGDYVIVYGDYALANSISSNRFTNGSPTISNNAITNPDESIVWHIAPNGDYWTIYNAKVSKYAGGNDSKNQGALIASVTDYAKFSVSSTSTSETYDFENYGCSIRSSNPGNKWLRSNNKGTTKYGWACYANSTDGAVTLYKLASTKTTVSFNLNGGSGTKPTAIDEFPATLPSTDGFTRSGYRPNGWNTKTDGSGTHHDSGKTGFTTDKTITLYVEWKKTYTVTYDGNGKTDGSVPTDSHSPYDENSSVTVLGNTGSLARTGYSWSGWNTNNSGTGTDRAAGSSFTITSNTTLYAKWTAKQTVVTLSAPNATTAGTTQVTATYDQAMPTTSVTMPQRTGYTFNGYFDSESGGTKYYNANGTSAKKWDKDVATFTLHAQWTAKTYTITYKNQGNTTFTGTHETGYPTNHTYDQTTTLKTATRTGYDFGGWYESEECSGSAVTEIGGQAKTNNFTLYAKWTARTTTVSFDKNTTDDVQNMPAGTITNTFDAALTTTGVTIPTRVGYTFVGWYDSSSKKYYGVTNEVITASVSKWDKADENVTLLAHWEPKVYTITYLDKGGEPFSGSWGTHPTQHTYGKATNLDSPTKAHFDFAGWYLNSDCSGESLSSLEATGYLDNITLYAKWNEHAKYTVTFVDDVHGTACSAWNLNNEYINTQIVFHSISDAERKVPTGDCVTDHYHFVGWIEEGVDPQTNPVISAGTTSIKITKNVTYKAVWAKEL